MIKWNNLGAGRLRRWGCKAFNWMLALLLMGMTLVGVVWLKWSTD